MQSDQLRFDGLTFTVLTELPEFGLVWGDRVLVRRVSRFECDAVYLTSDGQLVRMAATFAKDSAPIKATWADGRREGIGNTEAAAIIRGMVVKVLPNPGYHGPRTAPKPGPSIAIPFRQ